MTTAPKLIRAFLVAAACIAAFAIWTPAAFGQEAPPADPPVVVTDPPVVPDPPAEPPVVVEPPANPPVVPDPPADPPVVVSEEPTGAPVVVIDAPAQERATTHDEAGSRWDVQREPAAGVTQETPTSTPASSDILPVPAELPAASAGEDFAWTDKGDAFIFETGGSDGGNPTAVLASLSRFGSIAAAGLHSPVLDARERAARRAAQANTTGSGLVLVDNSGSAMLFFNLFGGGGGGGAALVMLTVVGLLAVFRLIPPDWTRAFRNSTAVWRPSAYAPPIEHPG